MDEVGAVFGDLEDPRTGNAKRHALHEILVIAVCTVLCGGETCADMTLFGRSKRAFLEEFLTLEHGIPSHDTISRDFTPDRCNDIVRTHRGIENRLHWVLDVVMAEDQARTRKDHGPENLTMLILFANPRMR